MPPCLRWLYSISKEPLPQATHINIRLFIGFSQTNSYLYNSLYHAPVPSQNEGCFLLYIEFENNVEKVTFTEVVGEETYIITIGSDGYFEGIGMSDEIKEELMELIVVGDLPTSEDNITDYFIKLREGTQQETP